MPKVLKKSSVSGFAKVVKPERLPANLKKLNDDIDAREAQAAEWRKQNGFGSVPRKDIVVTMFQATSLNALEEKYGRLTVSAAIKEHTIHYDKNTVTLRPYSKAIKFGTLVQTVAHGEEAERMTCLTPQGTVDVQVDKEGRIFDEARRWQGRLLYNHALLRPVRSDSDSEISETQELELPEGLEVIDDVPQQKSTEQETAEEMLPMPRLRKRHFDPDAFQFVQKYDEDGSSAPYSKEEYKSMCQRLCDGDASLWRSLHVLTQADLYNYAFTDFVLKWTELKFDLVDTKGDEYGDVFSSNDFNDKVYNDIENLIVATRGPDEVDPITLVKSLRVRNVAIWVNTNNKRMKTYMALSDIDFTIGPYNNNEVELIFHQHA